MQPLNDAWIGKYGTDIPRIIYTSLTEAFFTRVKLSCFGALVVAFPVIAGQIWAFVAPGPLQAGEGGVPALPDRHAVHVLCRRSCVALLRRAAVRWSFFIGFQTVGAPDDPPLELMPKVGEYVSAA